MSSFNLAPFSSNKKAKRSEDTPRTPGWGRGLFGTNTPVPKSSGQTNAASSLKVNSGRFSVGVPAPSPWRQQRTSGVTSRPPPLSKPQVQFLDRVEAQAPPPSTLPPTRETTDVSATTVSAPLPTRKRPHAKVGASRMWMSLGPAGRKSSMAPDVIKRIAAERNERSISAALKLSGDLSLISMNIGKPMNSNLSRLCGAKRFKSSHFSEPGTSQNQDTTENQPDFPSPPQASSDDRNQSQGTDTLTIDPPFNLGAFPEPVIGTAAGASPKGVVMINPGIISSREVKGIIIPPPVSADDDEEDEKATGQDSAAKAPSILFEPDDVDRRWKCTLCGFEDNLDHVAKCTKCNQLGRASEGPSATLWDTFGSVQSNMWKCLACTSPNYPESTKCASCEVPKGEDGEKEGQENDASAATVPTFSFMSGTTAPVKDGSGQKVSFGFSKQEPSTSLNAAPKISFGFGNPAASDHSPNTNTNVAPPVANPPPAGQGFVFGFGAPAPSSQQSGQVFSSFGAPSPAASNPQGAVKNDEEKKSDTPSTSFSFPTALVDSSASKPSQPAGFSFSSAPSDNSAPKPTSSQTAGFSFSSVPSDNSALKSTSSQTAGFSFSTAPADSSASKPTSSQTAGFSFSTAPADSSASKPTSSQSTGFSFSSAPADSSTSKRTSSQSNFVFPTSGDAPKFTTPLSNGGVPEGQPPQNSTLPQDPLTGKSLSSAEAASLSQFRSGDERGRAKRIRGREEESRTKRSATDTSAQKGSASITFVDGADSSMPNGTAAKSDSKSGSSFHGSGAPTDLSTPSLAFGAAKPAHPESKAPDTATGTSLTSAASSLSGFSTTPSFGGPTFGQKTDTKTTEFSNSSTASFGGFGQKTDSGASSDAGSTAPFVFGTGKSSTAPAPASNAGPTFGTAAAGTSNPFGTAPSSGTSIPTFGTGSAPSTAPSFGPVPAPTSGAPMFGSTPSTSAPMFGQPIASQVTPNFGSAQGQPSNGPTFGSGPTPGAGPFGLSSAPPANPGFGQAPGGSFSSSSSFNGPGPSNPPTFGTRPSLGAPAPGPFGQPPSTNATPAMDFGAAPSLPSNSFGQAAPQAPAGGGFNMGVGKTTTRRRIVRAKRPK